MKDKEILQKAIKKAVDNGWKPENVDKVLKISWSDKWEEVSLTYEIDEHGNEAAVVVPIYWCHSVIFSHSFAKAFWGEELVCRECGSNNPIAEFDTCSVGSCPLAGYKYVGIPFYKYCLSEMVLEEDPLKYLERFL